MKVSTADFIPAHAYPVAGVRYSYTDSAVPFAVINLQCRLYRSTARISFSVGNPWNLGCVLCHTETAVNLSVPHTVDCIAHILSQITFTSRSLLWTVLLSAHYAHSLVDNTSQNFGLSFEFLLHHHKYILTPCKHSLPENKNNSIEEVF